MYNPALYKSYNEMQRRDAKETIDDNWHKIQWREDGSDSIIEVGCGCGDVGYDYVLPKLPANFSHYVGVDSSTEMLEYARKNYSHEKMSYEKLDIGMDLDKQQYKHQQYDHVMSFYCLNWVQNQKQALKNMYNLLKTGGDMLVGILARNPVYDIYRIMSKDKKWSKYMTNVKQYISPYQYSVNPADDLRKLLASCGFKNIYVNAHDKCYTYEGSEALRNAWEAVNPWYEKIPTQEREEYWNDFHSYVCENGYALDDYKENPQSCRYKDPYKWMVAYAQK